MPTYNFEYTQTLELSIGIEAKDLDEALSIFKKKDHDGVLRSEAELFEDGMPTITKIELYA